MLTGSYNDIKRILNICRFYSFISKQKTIRTCVKRNGLCITCTGKTCLAKVISTGNIVIRGDLYALDLIGIALLLSSYIGKEAKIGRLVLQIELKTALARICILRCLGYTAIANFTKMLGIVKFGLGLIVSDNNLLFTGTGVLATIVHIVLTLTGVRTIYQEINAGAASWIAF